MIENEAGLNNRKISKVAKAGVTEYLHSGVSGETRRRRETVNVKPLADRVIVKPLEAEEVKKGSIIIPDTAKEKPQQGEIIAVGPGKMTDGKREEMEVKVGDKVLYGKYAGTEVTIDDAEYMIMRESDILAIL